MSEIEHRVYLIGDKERDPMFAWGDRWWMHEVDGTVHLALFGITPELATRIISLLRKEDT